jgi:hypothetical protein
MQPSKFYSLVASLKKVGTDQKGVNKKLYSHKKYFDKCK